MKGRTKKKKGITTKNHDKFGNKWVFSLPTSKSKDLVFRVKKGKKKNN